MKYNFKFWKQRYELLKVRGEVGQMSWNITQKVIDFQNELRASLKTNQFNAIVDFGCGTAKNTEFLLDVFHGKRYIGYDIVDLVIKENSKKYAFNESVFFRLFEDEIAKTDVIWSSFTLQHFNDDDFLHILKVFKKALKKNGKIYIVNAIIDGTDTDTMFYRTILGHFSLFKKADLNAKVLYQTKVSGSDIALFELEIKEEKRHVKGLGNYSGSQSN